MITSQRPELPNEINIYCATWTRLWLCAHRRCFGHPITAIVYFFAIAGGHGRIVNIAKAKVGFIEPMLAWAVTKLLQEPRSYELKFDGYRVLGMRSRGALVVVSR